MKRKSIAFILAFCFGHPAKVLAQDLPEVVAKDIQKYEESLERSKLRLKRTRERLGKKTEEAQRLRQRIEELTATRSRRKEKIANFKKKLESAKKDLPWLKRRFSGEGRTLGCLIKAVEVQSELSRCGGVDELDGDLRLEVNRYEEGLGLSDQDYKKVLSKKETALQRTLKDKSSYEKRLPTYEDHLGYWEEQIDERRKDLELYLDFKNAPAGEYVCGPQTRTIDLEADAQDSGLGREGIFKGLGRDHQNGLGTCFANTAKNLLYAATDGEVNASFLDIALQYKGEQTPNIDGGSACHALKRLHKKGYCPKLFSPLETGESMPPTGLISGFSAVSQQARMIDLISEFLRGNNDLKKEGLDAKVAKNASRLIQALKNDPLIELPTPSIGLDPVNDYKMNEYFYWGYPKDKRGDLDYEAFKEDFKRLKEKFDFAVVNEIRKKESFSFDKLASEIIGPFLEKHHVDQKWRDKILVPNLDSKLAGFDREEYLRKLDSTEKFIALMDGRKFGEGDFDFNDFLSPSCRLDSYKILNFGSALEDLVDYVRERKLDPMILTGEKGFKSNREVLQLAIAPNCVNPENRQPSPDVYCNAFSVRKKAEDFGLDKKMFTRFRTLKQLKKGLPVGNSYQTDIGWHINTVVGFRYNPKSKRCEYKIRESQTARAFWMDENKFSNKIYRMTVVEK